MKRMLLTVAAVVTLLMLTACKDREKTPDQGAKDKGKTENVTKEPPEEPPIKKPDETLNEIVDPVVTTTVYKNGKKCVELTDADNPMMTDFGIIYTKHQFKGAFTRDEEYHLLVPDTGEDRILGTVNDLSYETVYDRVEMNGKVYTLIMKGELDDLGTKPLILLEIDPMKGLTERTVCESGFPYAMLAKAADCLLIGNHNMDGSDTDSLWAYRPEDGTSYEVKRYPDAPLRHIYRDGKRAYALCARMKDGKTHMVIEQYDSTFSLVAEQDVTAIFEKACAEMGDGEARDMEMRQHVSGFHVTEGGMLYYENFSCTHFLADMNTGKILRSGECFCDVAGKPGELYYEYMKGFRTEASVPNTIYILSKTELTTSEFKTDNPDYYITDMSVSQNGTRLTRIEYKDPENRGEDLAPVWVIE